MLYYTSCDQFDHLFYSTERRNLYQERNDLRLHGTQACPACVKASHLATPFSKEETHIMATTGMTPSENARAVAAMVREEDLQELEALHSELVNRVDQARSDGRVYLMSQYVRLIALVSPDIDRVQRRFKRETLASLRKDHKTLKEQRKANTTS